MTGPVIGGVAVEVAPDARGWVPKFRAQVLPGAGKVGDEYGRIFGDEASQRAVDAFSRGMAKTNPRLDGTRQGDAFGSAFSAQIRKALDNLPKAKLDANATEAERKLDRLRTQLSTLDKTVGVHVSDQAALNALNFLRVELDSLTTGQHDIRVRFNAQTASAELAALQAKLAAVGSSTGNRQGDAFGTAFSAQVRKALENLPRAKLDADATEAEKKLDRLRDELSTLDTRFDVDISDQAALGELRRLRVELDRLTLPEHDIRVRLNAQAASAELAGLEARLAALSGANVGAGGGLPVGVQGAAIISAVPLAGPAAAAAAAGLFQFAAAAGVAALAVKGLNNEVHDETQLGQALQGQIGGLKGALAQLEGTAVRGASTGVLSGLKQINAFLPTLNPEVEQLSRHLGNAFSVATGGLIAGLQVAEPLLNDAGGYAEELAQKLASAAKSPEFAQFIAYSRKELPVIGSDLGDVAKTAVDLGVALQPIGDEFLKDADAIVRGVDRVTGPLTALTHLTGSGVFGKGVHFLTESPITRLFEQLDHLGGKSHQAAQQQDQQALATQRQAQEAEKAAGSFQAAAGAMGTSEQAAKAYALMSGITADAVGKNKVSQDALNASVARVASAYAEASQSGSAYLASLSQFAQSEATAVDRAALIGATLRAANGDALAFGGAMAAAAQADTALTTAFADQAAQAASNSAAVASAQSALSQAQSQASRSLQNAIDGVATSERALTSAQQQALAAQKALTGARKAAKMAAEDLANQVIDGQLSERQAVLSLQAARAALGKPSPAGQPSNAAAQQLAYDQAVQQLKEIRLQNQRLAAEKAASDKAGINGSQQVVAAQQNIASATQAVSDAHRALVKSQQAVTDAQVSGAQSVANAQRSLAAASAAQVKAMRASELAAIDAKTGLIDYSKEGAGPLVQQLQAIQDAAQKAAEATYQHELATEGGTVAAEDAGKVYDSLTRGALTRQAEKLGLTKDAAQKLADQYFRMPDDVSTTIAMIGGDRSEQILDQIGRQLSYLTHQPWVSQFGIRGIDGALAKVIKVQTQLRSLADSVVYMQVNEITSAGTNIGGRQVFDIVRQADGGILNGLAKVQHFANGAEDHIAQIAPAGTYRVWAEKETEGEAYIPLAPSKRARSELILAEVARKFGDTLVRGGARRPDVAGMELRSSSARQGNITVEQKIYNPLPEPASVSGPKGLRRAAYALGN